MSMGVIPMETDVIRIEARNCIVFLLTTAALFGVSTVLRCAEISMSGSEAIRAIDWNSVKAASPIPALMPTIDSDDPLEAGFAPQWIKRSLGPMEAAKKISAARTALTIISKKRMADDTWANGVDYELRKLIRTKIASEQPTVSRVFCSASGCLCYWERENKIMGDSYPTMMGELRNGDGWAKEFGIEARDISYVGTSTWTLFLIVRRHPS
jgi:hypothetical protein